MAHTEQDVLDLLTDHSSEESWLNRQLGAQLAAQQKLPQLERVLGGLLKDRVDWVRYHAFQALVRIDAPPERLIPVAKGLKNDQFFRVRQAASAYLDEVVQDVRNHSPR